MPRKRFFPTKVFPYHITNRSNNKDWFYVPPEIAWRVFTEQLCDSCDLFSVWIHSFVLMSNHFHMVATTPGANLDKFLRHFLTEVCRQIQKEAGRINHVFGARSSQTVLGCPYSVAYGYKYVYRNPVRAGLTKGVEEFPFSSLRYLAQTNCPIPAVEGLGSLWSLVPKNEDARLHWLNLPTPKEQEQLVGRALKRSHFQFSRSNAVQKALRDLGKSYAIQ